MLADLTGTLVGPVTMLYERAIAGHNCVLQRHAFVATLLLQGMSAAMLCCSVAPLHVHECANTIVPGVYSTLPTSPSRL
jgi:hypothetical protein